MYYPYTIVWLENDKFRWSRVIATGAPWELMKAKKGYICLLSGVQTDSSIVRNAQWFVDHMRQCKCGGLALAGNPCNTCNERVLYGALVRG